MFQHLARHTELGSQQRATVHISIIQFCQRFHLFFLTLQKVEGLLGSLSEILLTAAGEQTDHPAQQ